jgi:hypothetical protein
MQEMDRETAGTDDPAPPVSEFARRLRAYMGYADRTLEGVAAELHALGVSASASTVNRWARGQSKPDIYAAQALGRMVESSGLAASGDGTNWLLGTGPVAPAGAAQADLDSLVGAWHFRTSSPALSDILAERGVPAAFRRPLAELLAGLLAGEPAPSEDRRAPPRL